MQSQFYKAQSIERKPPQSDVAAVALLSREDENCASRKSHFLHKKSNKNFRMDDPFFAAVGDSAPVAATKTLEPEERRPRRDERPARPPPRKREKDPNAPRLPCMLDDVPSEKPLKINPNKPPTSKRLYGFVMPEKWEYAKPYD